MNLNVTGIVIREADLSESDKLINILTEKKGIVSVIAKRSKTIRNKFGGMLQLFAYGDFSIFCAKNGYMLEKVEFKELFLELRNDLEALSLAQYFCEIVLALRPEPEVSSELLRTFLNCIFYLNIKKFNFSILKSIFELKSCSLCGYMPELIACYSCGKYEANNMSFAFEDGKIFCSDCTPKNSSIVSINSSIVFSLRHIVYSPIEKLFNFSISENALKILSYITEKYVLSHVFHKFKSLDFYKKLSSFKI